MTEGVAVRCATAAYELIRISAKGKGEVTVGMLTDGKRQLKAAHSRVLHELWTADN